MILSTRIIRSSLLAALGGLLIGACADGCDCSGGPPADSANTVEGANADQAPAAPGANVGSTTTAPAALPPSAATPTEPTAPATPPSAPPSEGSGLEALHEGSGSAAARDPRSLQLNLQHLEPNVRPAHLDPRAVRPQFRDLRLSPGSIAP